MSRKSSRKSEKAGVLADCYGLAASSQPHATSFNRTSKLCSCQRTPISSKLSRVLLFYSFTTALTIIAIMASVSGSDTTTNVIFDMGISSKFMAFEPLY